MPARQYILPTLSWVNFNPAKLAICPTLELPEQEKTKISSGSQRHFSSIPFSLRLFNPFLNFFDFGYFAGDLDHSIHHQSRRHHHPVVADGFDILNFNDFRFNAEFFYRLFGSILELIAFRSTHSQNFDLFHRLLLFYFTKLRNPP
jgi:hypothetical protein